MQKQLLAGALAALLAVMMACGGNPATPANPASPSPVASNGAGAAADGTTLKATAPTLKSPIGGERVTVQQPTLTIGAATGRFVTATFLHRIQVTNDGGTLLFDSGLLSSGVLSFTVPANLDNDKLFRWRARAEFDGAVGPWSAYETFLSLKQPEGYIRGSEVFDPLMNGKTVGEIHGPVQFIVGQGVKLLTHQSYISYNLQQTLSNGEFSIMVTGMDEGSPGDKSKVMSMQEDGGDITTNDYRFTAEKRGRSYPTPGAVTFRVISGDSGEEGLIHDGARKVIDLSDSKWYFWKAIWGSNRATLEVHQDETTGPTLYQSTVSLGGHEYRPTPHVVHLGAPMGRAGEEDATVPGMIIKNVWVGATPRPAFVDAPAGAK